MTHAAAALRAQNPCHAMHGGRAMQSVQPLPWHEAQGIHAASPCHAQPLPNRPMHASIPARHGHTMRAPCHAMLQSPCGAYQLLTPRHALLTPRPPAVACA